MRKRISKTFISRTLCGALVCTALGLAACGEDSKTIGGSADTTASYGQSAGETQQTVDDAQGGARAEAVSGYCYQWEDVQIAPDMDMIVILEALGQPISYFEAPSCAFEGLDKIYTYSGFEIDTYPRGEKDCISSIILKDDTVSTAEGISIGAAEAEVREVYGEPDEEDIGMLAYRKEDTELVFVVSGGSVASIEYNSMVSGD